MGTTIMKCTCKDEYQDKMYGKGNRVHNVSEKSKLAFCTVCSPSQKRVLRYYVPASNEAAAKAFGLTYKGIFLPKPDHGGKRI